MNFGTPELRRKLKAHYKAHQQAAEAWRAEAYRGLVILPPFPEECAGLRCGAKTRMGTPCKNVSDYANGRCKFHGGMSTGPKTPEGKLRSAMNGKIPKKRYPSHSKSKPHGD